MARTKIRRLVSSVQAVSNLAAPGVRLTKKGSKPRKAVATLLKTVRSGKGPKFDRGRALIKTTIRKMKRSARSLKP